MQDVVQFFKSNRLDAHKNIAEKKRQQKTLQARVSDFNNARRETRDGLLYQKRQIDYEKQVKEKDEINKRFQLLKKWKMEKEQRREKEKRKIKPVFKVSQVPKEIPNIENKNKQITKKKSELNLLHNYQSRFAPLNYEFKAPRGLIPILMDRASTNLRVKSKANLLWSKTPGNSFEKPKFLSRTKSKDNIVQSTKAATVNMQLEANKLQTNNVKPNINLIEGKGVKSKLKAYSQHGVKAQDNNNNQDKPCRGILNSVKYRNKKLSTVGSDSEVKVSIKRTPRLIKSPKMSQKCIGKTLERNHVEIVRDAPADITTPKRTTKKYNKTPMKRKIKSSDAESSCKSDNKNVKEYNSSVFVTPKNIKKSRTHLEKNQEIKKRRDCDMEVQNYYNGPVQNDSSFCTPLRTNSEASPVYVSPFVTVSRGKGSARKEYQIRQSVGEFSPEFSDDILKNTSPKAGAAYFLNKLNNETSRIRGVCNIWNDYKTSNKLPEEAIDTINVAIGQSSLLISKRFQRFRNLIEQCKKYGCIEKAVTCEDLHGFWDLIYLEVENLHKRFNNLNQLKANNWQETVPVKNAVVKPDKWIPKEVLANVALRNFIKTARDAKKPTVEYPLLNVSQTEETEVFHGGYYAVKSPVSQNSESNKSLRVSLLNKQTKNRMSSSGLIVMKISQAIKCDEATTPSKSILKSDLTRSTDRFTKSVLFKDNLEDDVDSEVICMSDRHHRDINIDESDINEINLITFSPGTPVKRSKRLIN